MLFDPELFDPPLFASEAPATAPPAPIFIVTRDDSGTPYTFTAPIKDPNSIERHGMDWSSWLGEGDAIDTADVLVEPAGMTVDQVEDAAGIVSWRMQGGANGQNYIVTCRITTTGGLADDRSVQVRVRER